MARKPKYEELEQLVNEIKLLDDPSVIEYEERDDVLIYFVRQGP